LAIYLAARGWDDLHDDIEIRLLPVINDSMTERLFQRAVEVGDHPAIRDTVQRLLGPGGVFETLDVWASGSLTLYLGTLAPETVCGRVLAVVAAMPDEECGELVDFVVTGADAVAQGGVLGLRRVIWSSRGPPCLADRCGQRFGGEPRDAHVLLDRRAR
jgi:hypothetical protein